MLIAALRLVRDDGSEEVVLTDEAWEVSRSNVTLSGIFIGEDADMTIEPDYKPAKIRDYPKTMLIPQEGPEVREQATGWPWTGRRITIPRTLRFPNAGTAMTT